MKSVAGVSEKFKELYVIHKANEKVEVSYTCCNLCWHIFRWVELRPPNYCPECGHRFYHGEQHERNRSI